MIESDGLDEEARNILAEAAREMPSRDEDVPIDPTYGEFKILWGNGSVQRMANYKIRRCHPKKEGDRQFSLVISRVLEDTRSDTEVSRRFQMTLGDDGEVTSWGEVSLPKRKTLIPFLFLVDREYVQEIWRMDGRPLQCEQFSARVHFDLGSFLEIFCIFFLIYGLSKHWFF